MEEEKHKRKQASQRYPLSNTNSIYDYVYYLMEHIIKEAPLSLDVFFNLAITMIMDLNHLTMIAPQKLRGRMITTF